MKKTILACLTAATVLSSQAQWLAPEAVGGALWGGLIGGVAGGHHRHGFSGNGAAIGAGVGFLAGSLIGESRHREYYYGSPCVTGSEVAVTMGYGYTPYVYYTPNAYCAPGYYYQPARPNYIVGGTVLGAASGALIGAADRHAGTGAAIGAAAGLVLGSAAEIAAQHRERKVASQMVVPGTTPVETVSMPSVTAISPPHQITSSPCASSTYHWTARPQIADAPRVPDAPTF